ncbi:MAG: hypothetical protein IJW05_01685 [Lentisphaeria bacterium]|nr:hypothetical protein [Lentisphaeria bacterium]
MGALATDWLGRYGVNGGYGGYGVCAGVREEWLSVGPRFSPLIPVFYRFSRQSRRDGRTRNGLAGELGILGVLGLLGALSVFCAGVSGEKPLRTALSLPALSQYS